MNGRELSTYSDRTNNISYKYDLLGIRTSKTINNITTNYYVKGRNIIFEDRNGTMLYYLYNGDELLGFIYNNNTYYYHKNLFQDIIGIYDSNYNEIVIYDYDSWGVIKNITDNSNINLGTINPFRYRSYYYDTETELYYLNSRYYNPRIGRFLNADAYLSTGQDLIGFNMFCYCCNNSLVSSDKKGTYRIPDILIGIPHFFAKKIVDTEKSSSKKIHEVSNKEYSHFIALTIIQRSKTSIVSKEKKSSIESPIVISSDIDMDYQYYEGSISVFNSKYSASVSENGISISFGNKNFGGIIGISWDEYISLDMGIYEEGKVTNKNGNIESTYYSEAKVNTNVIYDTVVVCVIALAPEATPILLFS